MFHADLTACLSRIPFGRACDEAGVDKLAKKLIDYQPKMSLKNFYVVKDAGRMVSTISLIPVVWSIGGIHLKVAEMGHVGTLPEYRGRGLIQRLVDEYHKEVQNRGTILP